MAGYAGHPPAVGCRLLHHSFVVRIPTVSSRDVGGGDARFAQVLNWLFSLYTLKSNTNGPKRCALIHRPVRWVVRCEAVRGREVRVLCWIRRLEMFGYVWICHHDHRIPRTTIYPRIHANPYKHTITNIRITALLTALCASIAFAKHILQLDGHVKIVPDIELDARQFILDCRSNNFTPPCGCGRACENACSTCLS